MPKQKEYELIYDGKEREEDIIAETMSVPLQKIKEFGDTEEGEWRNKLIFGENLQVLKYLLKLKEEGKLRNPDGRDGIKFIYIDPPFASKQDFKGSKGQKAYQDKIAGAEFLEFLRKRLLLLRELMTKDANILIHLDWHKVHYVKVLLDEIFGENNFRSEIVWAYRTGGAPRTKGFSKKHDIILHYSLDEYFQFSDFSERNYYEKKFFNPKVESRAGERDRLSNSEKNKLKKLIDNNSALPAKYKEILFDRYYTDVNLRDVVEGEIKLTKDNKAIKAINLKPVLNLSSEYLPFDTQKPEGLLDYFITILSNRGDITLDCFSGTGTTGAVADKLERKWIMIDSSKFSIYLSQKRLLNLKEEIGNRGRKLEPKPFALYNAGIYKDSGFFEKMETEEYKRFVLELFQAEYKEHELNGLEMHGLLNNRPVFVFSKDYLLTKEFIEELNDTVGSALKDEMYIIVPQNRVKFNEDYLREGSKKYVVLRIPYSIIQEIKEKNFERIEQPSSEDDINKTISQVGFDFIYPPDVEFECYFVKENLFEELVIDIKGFKANQISKNPVEFEDEKDALSIVMVDRDYNGEYFNITDYFFRNDIEDNNFKVKIQKENLGEKIMIIFMDILGNERKEVLKVNEIKKKY